jgi:lipoprotein-anchoring transpeptidase ErfK/SrfK
MSQPEVVPVLKAAHQAMKAGQKDRARTLLQEASRLDPNDHRPWLWLAGLAPTPEASLGYIVEAEARNSADPAVVKGRAWAEKRLAAQAPARPQPARRIPPLAAVAAVVLLFLCLVAAGGMAWFNWSPSAAAPAVAAQTPAPADVAARQANDSAESSELAALESFVVDTAVEPPNPALSQPEATPVLIQPKQIAVSLSGDQGELRGVWTATPSPTPTPTPTPTPSPTPTIMPTVLAGSAAEASVLRPSGVGPNERWIDVNLTTQTLTAYEGNTAVRSTLISSGLSRTPTVTGQFRVYLRYTKQDMDGYRLGFNYYLRDVPYVQYFYGNYALHGTFWHSNFGQPMSHGCVNLPTPEAEWLFNWASIGTLVWVHY